MTKELVYAGVAIATCLIGFAIYIGIKYRGNDEKFNQDKVVNMRIWRVLQVCGVVMIVVLGAMQIGGWK